MFTTINIGKEKIHLQYDIYGKGKPILFIHGGGTDYHFHETFISQLSKYYQVFAFSYPGFGKSSNMKKYSLDNYLNLIDQFLINMNLNSICIIGHSMGAGLATAYSSTHPERVVSVVLLSPFLYPYQKNIVTLASNMTKQGVIEKEYIPSYQQIKNGKIALILSKMNKLSKSINLLKLYLFLRNEDISKYLNFSISTLGVIGEKDIILDPQDQLKGLNKLENIKILKYPLNGHHVLFIKKEEIVRKIREIYS